MQRELTAGDEDEFLRLARASVGLHHPWYTLPTTHEAFQAYLTRLHQPRRRGRLVCVRDSGAMAGVIIVDSIIRGRFQSASLSYAAFAPAGRGYVSEGLGLVLRYAFGELRLHRWRPASSRATGPRSPWSGGRVSAGRATRRTCCSSTVPGVITSGGPSPVR